ncbi:transcriptional regulator, RpiR family [Pelagirhabdus alkalitolerans]|uniref:Transcriptional regulator, RpiR family n=1 Tax=Pelagirhabdus alkalitolerans TaxID=1612202 RepID=A0A1G6GP21_9BACI|nr:MurR/RpiR family transcriptional regulator [Pelagirhabdus alkalitolerans]SDB83741.1 transcriptional regulator, RpiR family [Pelagirhabdus alkalitolerans]
MNLIEKQLNKYLQHLNANDIEIIKNINVHYKKIPEMKIKELAEQSYTSVSTIHRVIKKLGFEGFSDFRYNIKGEIEEEKQPTFNSEEYFEKTINDIKLTRRLNEKEITKVAKAILESRNCYCFGTGWKQKQHADNFSTDLLYYGKTFKSLRTIGDVQIVSEKCDQDTLILIVSLSGNSEEYIDAIKKFAFKNSQIVSVTLDTSNQLTSLANYSLYYKTDTLDNNKKHWNSITLQFLMDYLLESIVQEVDKTNP